jgi:hypothetical protein
MLASGMRQSNTEGSIQVDRIRNKFTGPAAAAAAALRQRSPEEGHVTYLPANELMHQACSFAEALCTT